MNRLFISLACLIFASNAMAQSFDGKAPIEIASDNLEVVQAENKAIFTGNVIAKQATTTMRAAKMVVFYHGSGSDGSAMGEGIYRIESSGNVVFTTPAETAQGDTAIYHVETDTIDLIGNVTLTREKNILKGTKLNYNFATGRSVLTGGASASQGGGRVRGLFIPKAEGQ